MCSWNVLWRKSVMYIVGIFHGGCLLCVAGMFCVDSLLCIVGMFHGGCLLCVAEFCCCGFVVCSRMLTLVAVCCVYLECSMLTDYYVWMEFSMVAVCFV